MGPLISKIIGLVLQARTIHYVVKNNLIDLASQGASFPYMNTEFHAIYFIEAVKGQWAMNKEVYALFIDFVKAYDNCHPDMIASELAHLGFPPLFVKLLHHWATSRLTILHINGQITPPLPTQGGVGQGDTMSCILYIIYLSSLNNFLASQQPPIGIISANGNISNAGKFVDDVHLLTNSLPNIQRAITATEHWGNAHGHFMQAAHNKTAIMHLPPPKTPPPPPYPPVTLSDGSIVPMVTSYKYLGFMVTPTLSADTQLDKHIKRVLTEFHRLVAYNNVSPYLPQTSLLQLLKSLLSPYLLSTVPITTANIAKLRTAIKPIQRYILANAPEMSPTSLLNIESGIPSSTFFLLRSIFGINYATMTSIYPNSPLVVELNEQRANPRLGCFIDRVRKASSSLSSHGVNPSIVTNSPAFMLQIVTRSIHPPSQQLTPGPFDAPLAAHILARVIVTNDRRVDLVSSKYASDIITMCQRVPPGPPTQTYSALAFSFAYCRDGAISSTKETPLSFIGETSSGNLLVRTTVPLEKKYIAALVRARTGAISMNTHPLAPKSWLYNDLTPEEYRAICNGLPCPFCPGAVLCPYHIVCECTHPPLVTARATLLAKATTYIPVLAKHILLADTGTSPNDQHSPRVIAYASATANCTTIDWTTPTNLNLLYRLVLVFPWPSASVTDPLSTQCKALGQLFDLTIVPNSRIHAISNSWVPWGAKQLTAMAAVFSAEVIKLNHPNGLPGRTPLTPPYDKPFNFKKRMAAHKKRKEAATATPVTVQATTQ